MKRTPIVLGGTLAGLIGVLTFHTTPAQSGLTFPAASGGPGTSATPGASAPANTAGSKAASPKANTKTPASTTRSATGPQVNYSYGVLSVKVTVSAKKIVNVAIASLNDGGDPLSQSIDQQSIPVLEQEAIQAQSANIQGVSGASYTSQGFQQSLQSALQSLGLQ